MSECFRTLRVTNPRAKTGFKESVDAVAEVVRAQIVASTTCEPPALRPAPRRRLLRVSLGSAALGVAAALVAVLMLGSPSGGHGVENATAAVRKAATLSAASAERSGTAVVRITENGALWAGTTIRWHGADLAVSSDAPRRAGKVGGELLVVDGILYGIDPRDGGWVSMGTPASIDPDSGTTPAEYLAAVREDVGGTTLRRITDAMTGPTTGMLDDGSTVYRGTVAAGLIARETGFKEGQAIRVLPFGYVAHDEAADPATPLATAVTVGSDGIVRELMVTWGGASAWTYTVTYSNLGATPAPVAPENARSLLRDRTAAP